KRSKKQSHPHHPALQALAIRDKKIYVLGTPHLPYATTRIYFDIEGDPNCQSAYLLGLIVERNGAEERHSFWADSPGEEPRLFQHFLDVVGSLDDFCIYTYGSYEAAFLRRTIKRSDRGEYGATDPGARGQRPLTRSCAHLLPHLFQRSERHRPVSGLPLDDPGRIRSSEHRVAEEVGGNRLASLQGQAYDLQPGGLRRLAVGDGVRQQHLLRSARSASVPGRAPRRLPGVAR